MNLEDILMSDDIIGSINDNLDDLLTLIPELKYSIDFEHKNPNHHLDVWKHTMLALSMSEKEFDVRLVLLLHDIGKPFSCVEGNVRHFPNHQLVSANMSKHILTRLGYDDCFIEYIWNLIRYHDTRIKDFDDYDIALKLYKIQKCDALAHNPQKLEKRINYLNNFFKKLELKK